MTARVVFNDSADADVEGIFADIRATAGEPTVLKYRAQFRRLYATLADYPKSGPARRALGSDTRVGIVFPYLVIYDYDPVPERRHHPANRQRQTQNHRRLAALSTPR